MKKSFFRLFALFISVAMLSGLLLTGCGGEGSSTQTPSTTNGDSTKAGDDLANAQKALDALMGGKMNEWPADKLPDVPKYSYGEVLHHGDFGDGEYVVKIGETNESDLDKYKEALESDGWDVSSSYAAKGAITLDLGMFADDQVQIIARQLQKSEWPGEIPPALQPPEGFEVIDFQMSENGENMWVVNYTCLGMDEAAANAYIDTLKNAAPWEGDIGQMTIQEYEWNGKKYGMFLELYAFEGGNTTFTYQFGIVE